MHVDLMAHKDAQGRKADGFKVLCKQNQREVNVCEAQDLTCNLDLWRKECGHLLLLPSLADSPELAGHEELHARRLRRAHQILLLGDHSRVDRADDDIHPLEDLRQRLDAVGQVPDADLDPLAAQGLDGGLGERGGADRGCDALKYG